MIRSTVRARQIDVPSQSSSDANKPEARPWGECIALAESALASLREGDTPRTREVLQAVLALAQSSGRHVWPGERSYQMPLEFAAGEHRDANDHPYQAVEAHGASARPQQRVVIHALSGFELAIDGIVLTGGLKPQRRPLDLLKALVVAEAPIGTGELADMLWPDSDGDTAHNCLQVALHRLRRLLASDHAVIVKDRKLSLNRSVCWCDAWAFASKAESLLPLSALDGGLIERGTRALSLYRGHLFQGDGDQIWAMPAREHLRRCWLVLIRRLGDYYEAYEQWTRACELYQHALIIDLHPRPSIAA
ncbi:MAG: hypothetical protein ABI612_03115 [Betaproteobacteria bacterium]